LVCRKIAGKQKTGNRLPFSVYLKKRRNLEMKKLVTLLIITLFLLGAFGMIGCEEADNNFIEDPMEDPIY
jgi:hypothetical protein